MSMRQKVSLFLFFCVFVLSIAFLIGVYQMAQKVSERTVENILFLVGGFVVGAVTVLTGTWGGNKLAKQMRVELYAPPSPPVTNKNYMSPQMMGGQYPAGISGMQMGPMMTAMPNQGYMQYPQPGYQVYQAAPGYQQPQINYRPDSNLSGFESGQ